MKWTIYRITNKVNQKIYIGITIQKLKCRFNQHCCEKKTPISNAIKKYGKENFTIESIDCADSLSKALKKETYYIELYNSQVSKGNGYNLVYPTDGNEMTEQIRIKIALGRKKIKKDLFGVFYNKKNQKWSFSFSYNRRKISLKLFNTKQDAAIARDIKLLEYFDIIDAINLMNYPENIEKYIDGDIKMPKRNLKQESKKSNFNYVNYNSKNKLWRARLNTKISKGYFEKEEYAAEFADWLNLKYLKNIEMINFPEKLNEYKKLDYQPPATFLENKKDLKYKNISFERRNGEIVGYRIYIERQGKKWRSYFKSLEEAILERDKILHQINGKD